MKCSACQLEIKENIRAHYGSEIHKINTRRQIHSAPPITMEEITSEQLSDDVSLEINGLEDGSNPARSCKGQRSTSASKSSATEAVCLFCDSIESNQHYMEHGISAENIVYIHNRVCYVCYEGFSGREDLKRHILSGRHRNVVTDGINLILENGKIIQGRNRPLAAKEGRIQKVEKLEKSMLAQRVTREEKKKILEDKNQLKISLAMNHQMHYKPDWMQ